MNIRVENEICKSAEVWRAHKTAPYKLLIHSHQPPFHMIIIIKGLEAVFKILFRSFMVLNSANERQTLAPRVSYLSLTIIVSIHKIELHPVSQSVLWHGIFFRQQSHLGSKYYSQVSQLCIKYDVMYDVDDDDKIVM